MRVAILADIHGNMVSFAAVLADMAVQHIDQSVCLGDVAEFGPQPRAVLAQLRALGCPVVMGNTDERLLHPVPFDPPHERARLSSEIESWIEAHLTDDDRAQMAAFAPTVQIDLGGAELLCFHGTPRSNTGVLLATTPEEKLAKKLKGHDALVYAGGHTHTQLLRRYGQSILVNPGSIGMPFELVGNRTRRPPWAEYAILQFYRGQLSVDLRRVPVDVDAVIASAEEAGMPNVEWWADIWRKPVKR